MNLAELIQRRHPFPVDFRVAVFLAGSKRAVWDGKHLHLSPAMHDLIEHADGDELKRLVESIGVLAIMVPDYHELPMVTKPWGGA